jgi:transposase InsO family protein
MSANNDYPLGAKTLRGKESDNASGNPRTRRMVSADVACVMQSRSRGDQKNAETSGDICSVRTMYRILDDAREVRERRDQARHPHYKAPELLATGPNQVWSWDITKLFGPVKWTYYRGPTPTLKNSCGLKDGRDG